MPSRRSGRRPQVLFRRTHWHPREKTKIPDLREGEALPPLQGGFAPSRGIPRRPVNPSRREGFGANLMLEINGFNAGGSSFREYRGGRSPREKTKIPEQSEEGCQSPPKRRGNH
ncbi:hypothetical protein RRG08_057368 [Elysia crispata]|uniref:Uncharacterized protein n=1 Tax=Elysia crispata TaxID=231223 RepID=A0AAE1CZU5_9GAST|nr:hypothetical protein RRG08_057368 [Elysia crispata]